MCFTRVARLAESWSAVEIANLSRARLPGARGSSMVTVFGHEKVDVNRVLSALETRWWLSAHGRLDALTSAAAQPSPTV